MLSEHPERKWMSLARSAGNRRPSIPAISKNNDPPNPLLSHVGPRQSPIRRSGSLLGRAGTEPENPQERYRAVVEGLLAPQAGELGPSLVEDAAGPRVSVLCTP